MSRGRSVGSDRQPTATAFGYVSGWHNGPTPWRCSGMASNPNGSVVACTHPAHTEDPQPVSNPVHDPSPSVYLPGDAGWRPAGERQPPFRLASPAGVLLKPTEPESPLWFSQRRAGITATDLPKILGLSDYGNSLSVWLDKRGELAWDEAGEAARWGTLLEDVVAREWARRREVKVRRIGVLRNVEDPWMRASLDRVVTGCPEPGGCALEVKTRSAFVSGRWTDDVPDDVYVQCTWQLIVSGLDHVHVAVLIGGQRLVQHVVRRDEDVQKMCLREAGDVWSAVQQGVPPYVEPSALLTKLLDAMHVSREGVVEVPGDRVEETQRLLQERRDALQQEKDGKAAAERAKSGLVQLLGGGEVAALDGRELYRYRPSKTTRTAWKDVLAAAKESLPAPVVEQLVALVNAHSVTSTSRSLILAPAPAAATAPEES